MKRRSFIKAIGAISALTTTPILAHSATVKIKKSANSKNILILGGTKFIGPVIVERLIEAGHQVTLFNRGLTNPHLFPQLEKIKGDRYPSKGKGLKALQSSRKWDVVIDTWVENPLCVKETIALFKNRCSQYIYTSTMAVYPEKSLLEKAGLLESEPLNIDPMPSSFANTLNYDVNKRIADRLVSAEKNGCVLRPHSICGINMDVVSDNQRYWPVRLQRGGIIAAPGDGADTTQYIDVKDLAKFVTLSIEQKLNGIYNTFTTERMDAYLYGLKSLSSAQSELVWIPQEFLYAHNIRHYVDMPMWAARQVARGTFSISNQKAINAGLTFRPLADTFSDVLAGFYRNNDNEYAFGEGQSKAGLNKKTEQFLLNKFQGV